MWSYNITDDPISDFDRYEEEQQEWLEKRPVCIECGEHIKDEEAYYIEGEFICEECIKGFKKFVDDFI